MNILGLDLGQTTGWAIIRLDGKTITPVEMGSLKSLSSRPTAIYCTLYDWLQDMYHVSEAFGVLAIEAAPLVTRFIAQGQHELQGVVRLFIEQEPKLISHWYYPVTVKAALGSGKLTKAEVRTRISAFLGLPRIKSPDEADALAVACTCALREYGAHWPQTVKAFEKGAGSGRRKKGLEKMSDAEVIDAIREGKAIWDGKQIVGIK
jgi:Holliday junction resolvasome RuvABC endonuclease subunit